MHAYPRLLAMGHLIALLVTPCGAQLAAPSAGSPREIALRRAAETMIHLQKHEYDRATVYFSASLTTSLPPRRLADTWAGLVSALGEPTGADSARADSTGTGFVVHVPVRFASMSIDATLRFDADHLISALGLVPVAGRAAPPSPTTPEAERLYAAGLFTDARLAFESVLTRSPDDYLAHLRLGTIALLEGRPREAIADLDAARRLRPDEREPRSRLQEARYREGDMAVAAELARGLGRVATAMQLEWLAVSGANRLEWGDAIVRIPFERTDPLPVVRISVNGAAPAYFLIDTGAGETILDPAFASAVGAQLFGADSSSFAGGKVGTFQHGAVASLQLGTLTVRNVPIHVQSTRSFSAAGGGLRIDGIIGTILFMQVMATLDYPRGELVLRPKTVASPHLASSIALPMWLASDHLMLIWGRANAADSVLMLLDTGLVGAAFVAPDTVFRAAGIDLANAPAVTGIGGGGPVTAKPVSIRRLQFGPIVRNDISALAGVFPPTLASQHGFPILGLISHELVRAYAVTFDYQRMRVLFEGGDVRTP